GAGAGAEASSPADGGPVVARWGDASTEAGRKQLQQTQAVETQLRLALNSLQRHEIEYRRVMALLKEAEKRGDVSSRATLKDTLQKMGDAINSHRSTAQQLEGYRRNF
ncbi:unnamed protein product, partial [Ectocarpus sp. 12 AP-2014]